MKNESLTLDEAAKIADCSPANLRFAIKQGKLKAAKFGKMWAVAPADLRAWIDADIHRTGPKKKSVDT